MTREVHLSAHERLARDWPPIDRSADDPVFSALAAFASAMAKEPLPDRLHVLLERLRAEETR